MFIGSSSSSLCSTPNDRSLGRALFDMGSILALVGLGHRMPVQTDLSTIPTIQNQPIVSHSSNEPITIKHPTRLSKKLLSSERKQTNDYVNTDYRAEAFSSPMRPNSLVLLSSSSSQSSSQKSQILRPPSMDNQQITDDENENYYSAQSSKLSTPMIHSIDLSNCKANFEDKTFITDTERNGKSIIHQTRSSTENNNSHHIPKKDFLH